MNAKQSYVLSRGYTDNSVEGLGTIKGANCEIDSITPSVDGKYSTVIFGWTGSAGTHLISELRVENGCGIKSTILATDPQNKLHLYVTYDDGTTKDAGVVPTPTIEVGETITVDYEEGADVKGVPTATGIKLDFQIPRGQDGTADPAWNIL